MTQREILAALNEEYNEYIDVCDDLDMKPLPFWDWLNSRDNITMPEFKGIKQPH
jgi:hypothetical protein